MSEIKQACTCRDWACGLPPCDECGEDHGGITFGDRRLCRDCHLDVMHKRIAKAIETDPEGFDRRLAEVAKLFGSKVKP